MGEQEEEQEEEEGEAYATTPLLAAAHTHLCLVPVLADRAHLRGTLAITVMLRATANLLQISGGGIGEVLLTMANQSVNRCPSTSTARTDFHIRSCSMSLTG